MLPKIMGYPAGSDASGCQKYNVFFVLVWRIGVFLGILGFGMQYSTFMHIRSGCGWGGPPDGRMQGRKRDPVGNFHLFVFQE